MEPTVKDIGKIIKKSWIFILILTVGTAAIGYWLASFGLEKEYEATALVIVSFSAQRSRDMDGMTASDYDLNVKLVNSYSVICKSERVLSQVRDSLGLEMELDKLSEKIAVTSKEGTDIISLSITDALPARAQSIANRLVEVFRTEVAKIMGMDNVQVIDFAALPQKPAWPNIAVLTIVAALIGLVASLVIAALRFTWDDTVKDVDSVSDIMGAPVIGSVPKLC